MQRLLHEARALLVGFAALLLAEAFPQGLLRGRLEASPYLWRAPAAAVALPGRTYRSG